MTMTNKDVLKIIDKEKIDSLDKLTPELKEWVGKNIAPEVVKMAKDEGFEILKSYISKGIESLSEKINNLQENLSKPTKVICKEYTETEIKKPIGYPINFPKKYRK